MNTSSATYTPEQIAGIKEIANMNITKIFMELDLYDNMKDKYPRYINGRCPIHKGDNNTAFSWDYDKAIFKCFTKGCDRPGNDVYGLLEQLLSISFVEAIEWVIEKLDINLDKLQISQSVVENISFIRNTKKNVIKEDVAIKDSILSKMESAVDFVTDNRGFKKEVVQIFEPRFGKDEISNNMSNRIAFPVRNSNGKIVGFTGRKIKEEMKIPKWLHNFDKMNHLYNFDKAKKYIKETGAVIIVEGPYDAMAFWNADIRNVVAIMGVELSSQQKSTLWSSGAFTAILAFDNGEAGEEATKKIEKELEKYLTVKKFKITEGKDDVGEMMSDELNEEYNRIRN